MYVRCYVNLFPTYFFIKRSVRKHMYRKDNVSARTQSMESKQDCFERNIYCLNIIFYLGKGFILRRQLIALLRLLYGINQHKSNDMIGDLLSHSLLIKKQATDTKTCIYVHQVPFI